MTRGDALGEFMGLIFVRLVLAAATLSVLGLAWGGNYFAAASIAAALAYFLYLYWRPIDTNDELTTWDPEQERERER